MDGFTRNDLTKLIEYESVPQISIYLPTIRAGAETQQNPIRFKNLLQQVEDELAGTGMRGPAVRELVEPVEQQLLNDASFWLQQSDGLAVFLAPDFLQVFRLPQSFEESALVSDHFYVLPLFHMFQNEGRFYILALSKNQVRLLKGSHQNIQEVKLDDMPTSLAEALRWDDPEKQLQHHTVTRGTQEGGTGRPEGTFHGHGAGEDDEKTNLLRYFHKVDQGLQEHLAGERAPLLLASVEYLAPIYREASSYSHIVPETITGNPDQLRNEELHQQAWALLEPHFRKDIDEAIELFKQLEGNQSDLSSSRVEEIVPAAYGGKVEHLFIRNGAEIWGRYDRMANRVKVFSGRQEEAEELLNTAAAFSFVNSGVVYLLSGDEMPAAAPVAANFRYG